MTVWTASETHNRGMLRRVQKEFERARRSSYWRTGYPVNDGLYERLTAFGVTVDRWTGNCWRRLRGEKILCANQNLPWRPVADQPYAIQP